MRLCLQFGCTLDELGQRMTAHEFGLWCALWAVEPWGDVRGDLAAGQVAAAVVNSAGLVRRKDAPSVGPMDFAPFLQGKPAEAAEPDPREHFLNLRR